jgi:hypothetical protein
MPMPLAISDGIELHRDQIVRGRQSLNGSWQERPS